MYAPDLSNKCQVAEGQAVRAVGWLEMGRSFTRGSVDQRFLSVLQTHTADPGRWIPFASAGVHFCDLGGCARAGGAGFVIIPSTTCVYVAPDLVVHYVEKHQYSPPTEFVAAVLACPEQSSAAYLDLLLPFAGIWSLDADRVRGIASDAPSRRRAHMEASAQDESNRSGFKW